MSTTRHADEHKPALPVYTVWPRLTQIFCINKTLDRMFSHKKLPVSPCRDHKCPESGTTLTDTVWNYLIVVDGNNGGIIRGHLLCDSDSIWKYFQDQKLEQ